jgi:hypothetical protein
MNIILAEASRYPIGSFMDEVKKKYTAGSILYCTSNNLIEIRKKIVSPPIYSRGWVLIFSLKTYDESTLESFDSPDNVCIYIVRSRDDLETLSIKMSLADLEYIKVDNMDPPKYKVVEYIQSELKIEEDLAEYIYNRNRGSLARVARSVDLLYGVNTITKAVIQRYTDPSPVVSYQDLFDYIIGVPIKYQHKDVLKLIKQYRHGVKYIMKFIYERFESYLEIYEHIEVGDLSIENYDDFKSKYSAKYKDMTEYSFKKAVESYRTVSRDKLYYLYWLYKKEVGDRGSVISLLLLLRLSKEGG